MPRRIVKCKNCGRDLLSDLHSNTTVKLRCGYCKAYLYITTNDRGVIKSRYMTPEQKAAYIRAFDIQD